MAITLPAGNDCLRIPFAINVVEMSEEQTSDLMDNIADTLGAKYFRNQALLMDVLGDQRQAAKEPLTFLYGPYVGVTPKDNGTLRIISMDKVEGGFTVYGEDQITDLLAGVKASRDQAPEKSDSPSP